MKRLLLALTLIVLLNSCGEADTTPDVTQSPDAKQSDPTSTAYVVPTPVGQQPTPGKIGITPGVTRIPDVRPTDATSLERVLLSPVGQELSPDQRAALDSLQNASEETLHLHISSVTRTPVWMKLRIPVADSDPIVNAKALLSDVGELFRLEESGNLEEFTTIRETDCCSHIRFTQTVNEIPVYAGGLEIVQDRRGWISEVRGLLLPQITIPSDPGITAEQARQRLMEGLASQLSSEEVAALSVEKAVLDSRIFSLGPAKSFLTWHFAGPSDNEGFINHWFVDAMTGQLLREITSIPFVDSDIDVLRSDDDWTSPIYHINPETGAPDYVTWQHVGGYSVAKPSSPPQEAIYEFLSKHSTLFADADSRRHQKIDEIRQLDDIGFTVVRTRQFYSDLPVFGVGLRYFLAPGNRLWSIHGNYIPQLKVDTDNIPAYGANQAKTIVATRIAKMCAECSGSQRKVLAANIQAEIKQEPVLGIFPNTLCAPPLPPSTPTFDLVVIPNLNTLVAQDSNSIHPIHGILAYEVVVPDRVYEVNP